MQRAVAGDTVDSSEDDDFEAEHKSSVATERQVPILHSKESWSGLPKLLKFGGDFECRVDCGQKLCRRTDCRRLSCPNCVDLVVVCCDVACLLVRVVEWIMSYLGE